MEGLKGFRWSGCGVRLARGLETYGDREFDFQTMARVGVQARGILGFGFLESWMLLIHVFSLEMYMPLNIYLQSPYKVIRKGYVFHSLNPYHVC